uniref:Uncharacterized protein n=1 Tax=Avena sativa TaxID=4498 RepID=A0ACD5X181_AVESA
MYTHNPSYGPRVDLPHFDGTNPRLWHRRCEEYFQRWQSPANLWVSYASTLFDGTTATWTKSYLQQNSRPIWTEFSTAVLTRFGHNQHQILVRRLFHIKQLSTIEDYVRCLAQLVDQIAAYETRPDPIHYTTHFLDGLVPAVRVLVAMQQPRDLDTAYTLALLYEELGDGTTPMNSSHFSVVNSRRAHASSLSAPPPPPPTKWISRSVEEKRAAEQQRHGSNDKWTNLKDYRRSKGLCFTCGEKWGREHQCKSAIQLHVVQEMINFMQSSENTDEEELTETEQHAPERQLMMLPSTALNTGLIAPRTMQLQVQIQGHTFLF